MVKYYLELKLNHLQGPTKGFLPYVPSLHARGTAEHREGVRLLTSAKDRFCMNDVSIISTPVRNKELGQLDSRGHISRTPMSLGKNILIDTTAQLQTTLLQIMLLRILNGRFHAEQRYYDYENRSDNTPM